MQNKTYANRERTDTFFNLPAGAARWTGDLAEACAWVQREQLMDPALWALFAAQFRIGDRDDHDLGWRCEYWGKMMRGACFTWACTQDPALYRVLEGSVRDLLSIQGPDGRLSTYSPENEFRGWDIWGRKYVMLGLEYFLDICADEALGADIVAALQGQADYILARIGPGPGQRPITATSTHWKGLNSSSILEPMVRLYNLTGEGRYLDFARYIIAAGGTEGFDTFEAALAGKLYPYQYPVTKAYEMMSCFEGIIEYYRVTGEEKYREMAVKFARAVEDSDITVIGCAGTTHELFDHSRVRQFDPAFDGIMQETCVTVTWMKLCRQLLLLTGDARWADRIEQSMYNALLGALNTRGNAFRGQVFAFDSYSPLLNGHRGRGVGGYKDLLRDRFRWGCCVAIGAAGTALPGLTAALAARDGAALALYLPGSVRVPAKGGEIALQVETEYPRDGRIAVTVQTAGRYALYLRIPAWSARSVLRVRGEAAAAVPGTFVRLERDWQAGDRIDLELDMRVRILRAAELDPDAAPEAACHAALRRGPVMLARDAAFGGDIREAVTLLDRGGYAEAEPAEAPFPARQAWRIRTAEGSFPAADYASCGQDWTQEMTVWVTTA